MYKELLEKVEDMIIDRKFDADAIYEMRDLLRELIDKEALDDFEKGDILLIDDSTVVLLNNVGVNIWIVFETLGHEVGLYSSSYLLKGKKVGHMEPKSLFKEVR